MLVEGQSLWPNIADDSGLARGYHGRKRARLPIRAKFGHYPDRRTNIFWYFVANPTNRPRIVGRHEDGGNLARMSERRRHLERIDVERFEPFERTSLVFK